MGAGTLGPVFRAFDEERDRLVAVKHFRLDLPPDRMRRFAATLELLTAPELDHPVLVRAVAVGTDGTVTWAAYEFVTAESLDVLLRGGGLASAADTLNLAASLAGALDFAAAVGVYHGALHPRDVLLTDDEVRLTGLGVAGALRQAGTVAPIRRPYAAPEQIAGGPWDQRADVFGLAALVFEMLSGRRVAGTGEAAARLLPERAGGDLAAMRAVFARALADRPANRFETALEFISALKAAHSGAGQPIEVLPDRSDRPLGGFPAEHDLPGARPASPPLEPSGPFDDEPPMLDRLEWEQAPPPHLDDFVLRDAEAEREGYDEVELSPPPGMERLASERPSFVLTADDAPAALEVAPGLFDGSASDRAPRRWSVGVALLAGLAIGFGGGYFVRGGDRGAGSVRSRETSQPVRAAAAPPDRALTKAAAKPAAPSPPLASAAVQPSSRPSASVEPPSPPSARQTSAPPPVRPPAAPETAAETPAAPAFAGRLVVRSSPAGATVLVDGRDRGRTPATIRDLARGTHRIQIADGGFVTENRRVSLTSSRPAGTLTVTLRRARPQPAPKAAAVSPRSPAQAADDQRFVGSLDVDSRPSGARVFLDGRPVGTTPMALPQVTAGSHVIRLEHDDYRRWTAAVRVVSGQANRVTASLER